VLDANNLDEWEYQYIKDFPEEDLARIAWTDEEAWERYPSLRWVYDKQKLAERYGTLSVASPFVVKPRINLKGMGRGVSVIRGIKKVAQEYLEGDHDTTDLAVFSGQVVGCTTFLARKDYNGSFRLFECIPRSRVYPPARQLVRDIAPELGYGIVNVETISGKIIEAHLRPSTQFFDIDGGLIGGMLGWDGDHKPIKTYSRVFRREKDARCDMKDALEPTPLGVKSIQFCFESGHRLSEYTQDPHSFRYLVINGTDLEVIEEYGKTITSLIRFEEEG